MSTGYDERHMAAAPDGEDSHRALCGKALVKWVTPKPMQNKASVNCPACLTLLNLPSAEPKPPAPRRPDQDIRAWHVAVVGGDTVLGFDEWCRRELGVGTPTPRQKPPRMEDERGMVDGVFIFYDVDYYAAVPLSNTASMEVVPQTTGNVEITLCDSTFTLSHLDRANLIRALLHDFHYSPERGGPNDDNDN